MNVYTYYQPVRAIDAQTESELIALWSQSWAKHGWTPVVLGHRHAARHLKYRDFDQKVRKFPSVNPIEYDRACWLRWLAFATVGGGTPMLTDYDVINQGFRPTDVSPARVCVYDRGLVPCAVSAKVPEQIVEDIMASKHAHDGRHYSDMLWFQTQPYSRDGDTGVAYKDTGWTRAGFVHFSHHACNVHAPGQRRADVIRKEIKLGDYPLATSNIV